MALKGKLRGFRVGYNSVYCWTGTLVDYSVVEYGCLVKYSFSTGNVQFGVLQFTKTGHEWQYKDPPCVGPRVRKILEMCGHSSALKCPDGIILMKILIFGLPQTSGHLIKYIKQIYNMFLAYFVLNSLTPGNLTISAGLHKVVILVIQDNRSSYS